jgi:hypothetical protein
MYRTALLALSAVALGAVPLAVSASMSDLVPARTGGFGEMTCQQCHWDNPLNDPSGQFTLAGIPEAYTPGEQYLITVALARPGVTRAGFQLSAREDGINMSSGTDAGVLRPADELTVTGQGEARRVTYIQHSRAGSEAKAPGQITWTFEWTAPSAEIPVVFHAAGNASNDDASPLGDFIYTTSSRTSAIRP